MKSLLIGLLAFSSICVFAGENKIFAQGKVDGKIHLNKSLLVLEGQTRVRLNRRCVLVLKEAPVKMQEMSFGPLELTEFISRGTHEDGYGQVSYDLRINDALVESIHCVGAHSNDLIFPLVKRPTITRLKRWGSPAFEIELFL